MHHTEPKEASDNVIDYDAESSADIFIKPSHRRRFYDVEDPEHHKSENNGGPGKGNGDHAHQHSRDLIDDDFRDVVLAVQLLGPRRNPNREANDREDHSDPNRERVAIQEPPDRQRAERAPGTRRGGDQPEAQHAGSGDDHSVFEPVDLRLHRRTPQMLRSPDTPVILSAPVSGKLLRFSAAARLLHAMAFGMVTARTFTYFALAVTLVGACSAPSVPSGPSPEQTTPSRQPALASAGPDAQILRGYPAELRGAGSYHPLGLDMLVQWEQLEGERVSLSNPEALEPTFIAPVDEQSLIFRLTVDDGRWVTTDEVVLHVVRSPSAVAPTVRAGPDRIVASGRSAALLDTDLLEGTETADWELVQVTASPTQRFSETYRGPTVYRLSDLRDGLRSAPDYLLVYEGTNEELLPFAPLNSLDGPDPAVVQPGETFTLDANTGISDDDGSARFRWEQLRGEPALDPTSAGEQTREVRAPQRSQELLFRVFRTVGGLESEAAEFSVVVRPSDDDEFLEPGTGVDLRSRPGRWVQLSSSLSLEDPDVVFEWAQTTGPEVAIDVNADDGTARFAAPESSDTLAFALTVIDDDVVSSPSVSTVAVVPDDENTAPTVFVCSSADDPEPGQTVVLSARIFDPEGDPLKSPVWSGPAAFVSDSTIPNSAGQTCAGAKPTVHGGPEDSSTVVSIAFEMPEIEESSVVDIESCDNRGACTITSVEFAPR